MSDFAPPPPPAPDAQPGFGPAAPGFSPAQGFGPAQPPAPGAPAPGYGTPAPGYGAPAAPGYGTPAPGYGAPQTPWAGYPVTSAGQADENARPGLAIVAGVGAMLVSAAVYAGIIDATREQYSIMALLVGLLVGFALGKLGGRNNALPFVAAVLALAGIFLGQLFGEALLVAKDLDSSATTVLFQQTSGLFDVWRHDNLENFSAIFYLVGALEAFVFTRRFAGAVGNPYAFKRRR